MKTQPLITPEMVCNYYGLAVERHPLPVNAAGFLDYETPPKFIAVNSQLPLSEQEVTATHELGHFLIKDKGFLRNHPIYQWVNRERTHPIAQKLTHLYLEQLNEHFDPEFFADLCAVCVLLALHRTDLLRLIVQRNHAIAPWVILLSALFFFRMLKRSFIPAMFRYFFVQIWI
jgi:hypothetical protein